MNSSANFNACEIVTIEGGLTQDEVDQDYNGIHIKDSFSDTDEEEQIKY